MLVILFFEHFHEYENFHNENYEKRYVLLDFITGAPSSDNLTRVSSGEVRGRETGDSKYSDFDKFSHK